MFFSKRDILEYLTVRLRLQSTIIRATRISGSVRWASLQCIVNSCITTKYLLSPRPVCIGARGLLQGPRVFLSALSVPFVGDLSSPFLRLSLPLPQPGLPNFTIPSENIYRSQNNTWRMRTKKCVLLRVPRTWEFYSMRPKLPAYNETMDTKTYIRAMFFGEIFLFYKKNIFLIFCYITEKR